MGLRTPLFDEYARLGARIVPFAGWDMPLHFGSQVGEHHAVRQHAGMFDVSHMRAIDFEGPDALAVLRRLLANDAGRLACPGQALYTCMLNPEGGVLDDLILYRLDADRYRVVVNAATAARDLDWMRSAAQEARVELRARADLAMIAVQGPLARERVMTCLPPTELRAAAAALGRFTAATDGDWMIARTGYTGEDGFEVLLPATEAPAFWRALQATGVQPCGLGARDTLRLEAGLPLYGQDLDETTSPLVAGLDWTVAWEPEERDFIGRAALEQSLRMPDHDRCVGLLLLGRGILRAGQTVLAGPDRAGQVTSGGFSPTLERSIALARVRHDLPERCTVAIRGQAVPARVVTPPFVRLGQVRIPLD